MPPQLASALNVVRSMSNKIIGDKSAENFRRFPVSNQIVGEQDLFGCRDELRIQAMFNYLGSSCTDTGTCASTTNIRSHNIRQIPRGGNMSLHETSGSYGV